MKRALATSSSIVPPGRKVGLSWSSGSGQNAPAFSSESTLVRNTRVCDLDEAACVACVVTNKTISEVEYIHDDQVPRDRNHAPTRGPDSDFNKLDLNPTFCQMWSKDKAPCPLHGEMGPCIFLYGAFVSHASSISMRRSRCQIRSTKSEARNKFNDQNSNDLNQLKTKTRYTNQGQKL